MGFFDRILKIFGVKKDGAKIVCVGLDNSGKTTLLNKMKKPKEQQNDIVPTVGFVCEKFETGGLEFTAWDFSGQGRYRSMWEMYYADASAVIFVIDSADRLRMAVAKDELETILQHESINKNNAIFLFFANKSDLPDSCTAVEVAQLLDLPTLLRGKSYNIVASQATAEDIKQSGLEEGILWLAQQLKEKQSSQKRS